MPEIDRRRREVLYNPETMPSPRWSQDARRPRGDRVLFGLRLRRADDHGTARDDPPDEALIDAARRGDLSAFNRLVERHERGVFSVALRHVRSPDAAEDITQDAFLRAWQSLDSFRSEHPGGFRAWILRIAANRALDTLRANARRPAESIEARQERDDSSWEPEADDESAFDLVSRTELAGILESAIGQLQPDQRLAIILSDIQGHPYEEIATISGVALGTVKSRINRGRARLREILLADETGRELLGRSARQESGGGE